MQLIRAFKNRIKLWFRGQYSREMLQKAGMRMGKNCALMGGSDFDYYHCHLIQLGDDVTVAPHVTFLAHDASTKRHTGYTRIGRIRVGNNVFIGAGSIILPGVTIGDNVVVGAGSVVSKSIPGNSVAVGNPARVIGTMDAFREKQERLLRERPVFEEDYVVTHREFTVEKREEMKNALSDTDGYVR